MADGPRQLPLALPFRAAFGAEDFLVSRANEAAVAFVEQWPTWPAPAVLIYGAAGCGKSHLVSVWRARSGGSVLSGADLTEEVVANLGDGAALAVDDIDRELKDERALFHLLNHARESQCTVLLTSRCAPGALSARIPDLRSRLRALPGAEISAPDDALLRALLVKLFSDRQLQVEPLVVSYILRHMERSAEAANDIVARIDRRSLADRRRVTRILAGQVLADRIAEADGGPPQQQRD
ncbi:MAG: DnaA/Hda family protein [Pseudomonadota bacterium]